MKTILIVLVVFVGTSVCDDKPKCAKDDILCELDEIMQDFSADNIGHLEKIYPLEFLKEQLNCEHTRRSMECLAKVTDIKPFGELRDKIMKARTYADFCDETLKTYREFVLVSLKHADSVFECLGVPKNYTAEIKRHIVNHMRWVRDQLKAMHRCTENARNYLKKFEDVLKYVNLTRLIKEDHFTFEDMKHHFIKEAMDSLECILNPRSGKSDKKEWQDRLELAIWGMEVVHDLLDAEEIDDIDDEFLGDLKEYFLHLLAAKNELGCPGACELIRHIYCEIQCFIASNSNGKMKKDPRCEKPKEKFETKAV